MRIQKIEDLLTPKAIESACALTEEEKALFSASLEAMVVKVVRKLDEEDRQNPGIVRSSGDYANFFFDEMRRNPDYISYIQYYKELNAHNWYVSLEARDPGRVPVIATHPFVHKNIVRIAERRERQLIEAINPFYFSCFGDASLQEKYESDFLNDIRSFFYELGSFVAGKGHGQFSIFRHDMGNYYQDVKGRIRQSVADTVVHNYGQVRCDFFRKRVEGKILVILG